MSTSFVQFISYDSDTILTVSTSNLNNYPNCYLLKLYTHDNDKIISVDKKNNAILLCDCPIKILECIIILINTNFDATIINGILQDNTKTFIATLNLLLFKYGFNCKLEKGELGLVVACYDDIEKPIFISNEILKMQPRLRKLIEESPSYKDYKILKYDTYEKFKKSIEHYIKERNDRIIERQREKEDEKEEEKERERIERIRQRERTGVL
jgi:hypothetical protein